MRTMSQPEAEAHESSLDQQCGSRTAIPTLGLTNRSIWLTVVGHHEDEIGRLLRVGA